MDKQTRMEFTYDFLDKLFRISIGENGDFSCALFNNDFSLKLEEAQRQKYEYVIRMLNLSRGSRVLDMGCGWGPFLEYSRRKGIIGTGVTLSKAQVNVCQTHGLDVHLMDLMSVTPTTFGYFDGVVCLGVFGHICSTDDWKANQQNEVYRNFFKVVSNLLPQGGRLNIDALVFDEKADIKIEKLDINASRDSDEFFLALLQKEFPGSWLANGLEPVIRNARPFFKIIEIQPAKNDYIETIKRWKKRIRRISLKKFPFYFALIPKYLFDKEFRHWLNILKYSPHRVCFERNLLDIHRLTFEKI